MFPPRVLDYQDRRLDPPLEAGPCPSCKGKTARREFTQAVRDAAENAVGRDEMREMFGPSNLYGDFLKAMADWIEDVAQGQGYKAKERDCAECLGHFWRT